MIDVVLEQGPIFLPILYFLFSPWCSAWVLSLQPFNVWWKACPSVCLSTSAFERFPLLYLSVRLPFICLIPPSHKNCWHYQRREERVKSLDRCQYALSALQLWSEPDRFCREQAGGRGRELRRDKPRSEEMTSQTEEWQFSGFQMIIPMHYSELWWIMDLQEETLTGAAVSNRWELWLNGRGLFPFVFLLDTLQWLEFCLFIGFWCFLSSNPKSDTDFLFSHFFFT